MFENQKKMLQLASKARRIQKELKRIEIEASAADDKIKVVFSGEQKIVDVEIDPDLLNPDHKDEVERGLLDAIREATKEAQKIAAEKMKEISGDLNIPGF